MVTCQLCFSTKVTHYFSRVVSNLNSQQLECFECVDKMGDVKHRRVKALESDAFLIESRKRQDKWRDQGAKIEFRELAKAFKPGLHPTANDAYNSLSQNIGRHIHEKKVLKAKG